MLGRQMFHTAELPPQLPLLPTKAPAADEGAQFDMSFDPMGGDYAAKYYQNLFQGMMPQVESSAPLDSMESGFSPTEYPHWKPTNEAAKMIQGGEYPDPLLRKAATWDVPALGTKSGFDSWFGRNFGGWF